ncbi:hypothetical protein DdX_11812 [Ditylenchus destructor]|uniref:Saposin B-type domain-containing protein n=1 Tax=Ditylenchus destructor TaxID=166010 RepID=A0AAD4QXU3_9BILA|nr:hypothetical protein DdX_11812 [Ditylenchus destructor]
MTLSGVKMSIVVVAFMVLSFCSAKSVGLSNLASLAQVSTQSDQTDPCQFCNEFVQGLDERGPKPEFNTSEKMAKGLEKICPDVYPGSPDDAFCKALKGKYDVFAKAYFQHKDDPKVDPCKVAGVCQAKPVGFKNLAKLSNVFAMSNETAPCEDCEEFVREIDERGLKPEYNTSERFAAGLQEQLQDVCGKHQEDVLCKALKGKYDVFAKAYFEHKDDPEVDPCKVAGVCQAKSVGFKNLAKLSNVFAMSNETAPCEDCEEFVREIDERGLKPEYNTSERFAAGLQEQLQDVCGKHQEDVLCKALKGKYDVFAKAYFEHKDDPEVDPCKVAGVCSAQPVGFKNLAKLSNVFAMSNETAPCEDCEEFVREIDERGLKPEYNTSERFAAGLQEQFQDVCERHAEDVLCKALKGKYDVFAKAYFQHKDDPKVDPCKVAGVCQAKSVGFKNLAKLSNIFAMSNETVTCKICNKLVAQLDSGDLGEYNTPEKLAKLLEETCSQPPISESCKAMKGKFLVFTKAYFRHREGHPEVDPCKVIQIC